MSDFSYDALRKCNEAEYKKNTINTLGKGKTKAGLVFMKFTRENKPKKVVLFVPFLKIVAAKEACAAIVKDKLHNKKFVACVEVAYDSEKLDGYNKGEITLTPVTSKGGLDGAKLFKEAEKFFKESLKMKLVVTDVSEVESEASSDSSTVDDDNNTATIQELRQEFQEAQQIYKQSKKLDPAAKADAIKNVSSMFKTLLPKLEAFISTSDKKPQIQTATKIKENIDKFLNALGGTATKGTNPKGTEKAGSSLSKLTNGIKNKAAQLLKNYQSEIDSIDGLADKLRSISQIA